MVIPCRQQLQFSVAGKKPSVADLGGITLMETDLVISTKVLQREENCEHIHEIVVGVFFQIQVIK